MKNILVIAFFINIVIASLPDLRFIQEWPRNFDELYKKYNSELRNAFSTNAKAISSISYDIPAQIRSLYPGNYLDNQVIYAILWRSVHVLGLDSRSTLKTCVIHPDHSRDMSSISPQASSHFKKKYFSFAIYDLFLFPYHMDGNHWIMLAFDRKKERFFIADSFRSKTQKTVNDYAKQVEIFSHILRTVYLVKGVPETHPDVKITTAINGNFAGELRATLPVDYTVEHKAVLWQAAWKQDDLNSCGIFTILFGFYFTQNYNALDAIWNNDSLSAKIDKKVIEHVGEQDLAVAYRKAMFINSMLWCLRDPKKEFPSCYGLLADDMDQMFRDLKIFDMTILTRDEILKSIEKKEIRITPFNADNVGCASVDLTLSNEFRYYKPGLNVIKINEETNYKDISEKVVFEEVVLKDGEHYLLLPGQACLGITVERITLSPNMCGLLEGRSRFARMGLFVHITAGFMNPGIDNRQVLEIYNASNHPLALYPGVKVCQFIFMRTEGEAKYQGIFNNQEL